jgi:hypothetical protein
MAQSTGGEVRADAGVGASQSSVSLGTAVSARPRSGRGRHRETAQRVVALPSSRDRAAGGGHAVHRETAQRSWRSRLDRRFLDCFAPFGARNDGNQQAARLSQWRKARAARSALMLAWEPVNHRSRLVLPSARDRVRIVALPSARGRAAVVALPSARGRVTIVALPSSRDRAAVVALPSSRDRAAVVAIQRTTQVPGLLRASRRSQ